MFNKVQVPVLGIVENMSYHVCSACGHHEALFGTGGGKKMAEQYQVALASCRCTSTFASTWTTVVRPCSGRGRRAGTGLSEAGPPGGGRALFQR